MRLPRKFSICHRSEFARVRELGKSRPGRYLVVSVLRSDELEHFKYGLIRVSFLRALKSTSSVIPSNTPSIALV